MQKSTPCNRVCFFRPFAEPPGPQTGSSDRTPAGIRIADNDAGYVLLSDGRRLPRGLRDPFRRGRRHERRPCRSDLRRGLRIFYRTEKTMMDDLETMKSGRWLHARQPRIREALLRCEELLFRFNALPPSRAEEREALIRELFGRTGPTFCIHSPFHCDFGSQITIGDDFTGNFNLTILDEAPVEIGDHVFIGPNVSLCTVTHALHADQRNAGIMRSLPIRIGNNVWIGAGCVVLQGVTIGDDTVVGAGSVITRDLPAGVVAFGNPCRVIRPLTAADRVTDIAR